MWAARADGQYLIRRGTWCGCERGDRVPREYGTTYNKGFFVRYRVMDIGAFSPRVNAFFFSLFIFTGNSELDDSVR
jgi:hypothetical protein